MTTFSDSVQSRLDGTNTKPIPDSMFERSDATIRELESIEVFGLDPLAVTEEAESVKGSSNAPGSEATAGSSPVRDAPGRGEVPEPFEMPCVVMTDGLLLSNVMTI
jgi:hypothetical protein